MAIKSYKPTTPSRRFMTVTDFSDLSKVYVIWDNDLYYFISLTDNQVETLKYRYGEPSDYSENAE